MKNITPNPIFLLVILLCAFFMSDALRYMMNPEKWGWPIEVRLRGLVLTLFVISILIITVWLHLSRLNYQSRIIANTLLVVITAVFGLLISKHIPFNSDVASELASRGIGQEEFDHLSSCDRFEEFMNASYRSLGIEDPIVDAPEWLHTSLELIPKNSAIMCIVKLGEQQLAFINGDKKDSESNVAKLHVLIFESLKLKIVYSPEIMDLMRSILQENRSETDPFDWIGKIYCAPLNLNISSTEQEIPVPDKKLCPEF